MSNFSFLACLEVAEKFVVVVAWVGGFQPKLHWLGFSLVELGLGFDNLFMSFIYMINRRGLIEKNKEG